MNTQKSNKLSRFAAVLLALSASPALMSAQTVSTTINLAKKVAATRGNTANSPVAQADNTSATTDGGVAAGTIPAQSPATANGPVQAIQPVVPSTPASTTTADPTSQVQNGINQVKEKKQRAKSIWNQIKTIKK